MISITWFLIAVVCIASCNASDDCDCVRRNYKQAYCKGNFAAIVKVTHGPQACFDIKTCYTATVVEKIKTQTTKFIGIETFDPTLKGEFADCGRNFLEGSQYLVIGNPTKKGVLKITSCDYVVIWTDLEEAKRKKILAKFDDVECDKKVDKFVDKAEDSAETRMEKPSLFKTPDFKSKS